MHYGSSRRTKNWEKERELIEEIMAKTFPKLPMNLKLFQRKKLKRKRHRLSEINDVWEIGYLFGRK